MTRFTDIPDALGRIGQFMIEASLPLTARAAVLASNASVSPVDRIVQFGRAVHEHRAELDPDARALGAAALAFAAQNGWHGLDAEASAMIADLQAAD